MGGDSKWRQWFGTIRIALSLIASALVVFWIILKSALRRHADVDEARSRASADTEAVNRAEKEGDAEWLRRDILRRAQRHNGDGT